jgi:hypothetical protein
VNGDQFGLSSGLMLFEYHAAIVGIGARNTNAAQASNRRALGDIGSLVGAMSVRYNVNKDGVLE